jgi:hypothetical protein
MTDPINAKRNQRYLLCPGWVTSKNDGQRHYIDGPQLAHLHGVSLRDCVILDGRRSRIVSHLEYEGLTRLAPRFDGNYSLPQSPDA